MVEALTSRAGKGRPKDSFLVREPECHHGTHPESPSDPARGVGAIPPKAFLSARATPTMEA